MRLKPVQLQLLWKLYYLLCDGYLLTSFIWRFSSIRSLTTHRDFMKSDPLKVTNFVGYFKMKIDYFLINFIKKTADSFSTYCAVTSLINNQNQVLNVVSHYLVSVNELNSKYIEIEHKLNI
jgi:hypothetical protein